MADVFMRARSLSSFYWRSAGPTNNSIRDMGGPTDTPDSIGLPTSSDAAARVSATSAARTSIGAFNEIFQSPTQAASSGGWVTTVMVVMRSSTQLACGWSVDDVVVRLSCRVWSPVCLFAHGACWPWLRDDFNRTITSVGVA